MRVSYNLKCLKQLLRKWNIETFGRVELELKGLESRIMELEEVLSSEFSQDRESELLMCKQHHMQWLHHEEILACQKSRIKWLTEGDSNSAFFHASLHIKKRTN